MKFSRYWAMPDPDTFSVPIIGDWVKSYLAGSTISVDPFARNKRWATHTNDLNPLTAAEHHMDAVDFLRMLVDKGTKADLVILDPPYSPRQIAECYQSIGKECTMTDTQSGAFKAAVRQMANKLVVPGGTVLSFGWNSVGMGRGLGYELVEFMTVCGGGDHNDTICIAEIKQVIAQKEFEKL